MKALKKILWMLAILALFAMPALATDPSPPDASGIVTTATNTFYTVGGLIGTIVGFFIIVKIVKWIRK